MKENGQWRKIILSFDTIDLLTGKVFQVTWDIGRRCNYDCSYCPAHRHDNFSPHAKLDDLKRNVDFLFEYIDTYVRYRFCKEVSISFTGGEPTVNPYFIPFIEYLTTEYQLKYNNKWLANFALTSNGAMGEKMAEKIMLNFDHITISYHTESDVKLKNQVKDRIIQFKDGLQNSKCNVSVNVMFHAADNYFRECVELCDFLKQLDVPYVPRIIGEEAGSKSNFAHQYTENQLHYIKNHWKNKNEKLNDVREETNILSAVGEKTTEKKKLGFTVGRPCCGSREMCLSNQGKSWNATFVDMREFKGWACSVNWFFLHLEQQTDNIYHHQTCQARFDKTRGPIGKLSKGKKLISQLKRNLENNTMPTIICPKHTCSCGLCAPKSKHTKNYIKVMKNHMDTSVLGTII